METVVTTNATAAAVGKTGSMTLLDTGQVVATGVIKLFLAGSVGCFTFRQLQSNSSSPNLIRDLSLINKEVLIPCLIFTSVAQGITLDLLLDFAAIPALMCCFICSGVVTGLLIPVLCGDTKSWPVALVTCTFTNVVGLPLPLITTVVAGLTSLQKHSDWASLTLSYVFIANTCISPLMWTLGPRILSYDVGSRDQNEDREDRESSSEYEAAVVETGAIDMSPTNYDNEKIEVELLQDTSNAADEDEKEEEEGVEGAIVARGPMEEQSKSKSKGVLPGCVARVVNNVNRPTMASLCGILVGCTPLRDLLSAPDAPLRTALDGLNLIGSGAIPLLLFTLGGTLSKGPPACRRDDEGSAIQSRTMFAVVFAKLMIVPAFNLGWTLLASRLMEKPDPLMLVVMAILGASPTAMNIATIAAVVGRSVLEVSGLLFWQYALASLTMTLFASAACVLLIDEQ